MEHALALTLQQITGSQQDTACTHQNICHPVGGTGLDQLAALRAGILYRGFTGVSGAGVVLATACSTAEWWAVHPALPG